MTGGPLDRALIDRAFRLLAAKLRSRHLTADVYVFGGAAMVLAFEDRPATRDVDAVFRPDTEVRAAADEVARELELPRSWLNDQASAYLPRESDPAPRLFGDFDGVRNLTASPEVLLTLKLRAARRVDLADLRLLASTLRITSSVDALEVHDRFFPDDPLGTRQRQVLADLFGEEVPRGGQWASPT